MKDRRIDYLEFEVLDLEKSKQFYGEVFGWTFQDCGPDYVSFTETRLEGGFAKVKSISKGGALVVFYSSNLETTSEKIKSAGGSISQATFSFPGGCRFHFTDPNGNELAVWSDKTE